MSRFRIEVEDRDGGCIVKADSDAYDALPPATQVRVQQLVHTAVEDLLAERVARTEMEAVELLLAETARRVADRRAYDREATRRGVLAL